MDTGQLALPDHRAPYDDLGPDYLDQRAGPEREARRLIARLEALGKHVTLHDAA